MKNKNFSFKAGDTVYCPLAGNLEYKLHKHPDDAGKLILYGSGESFGLFSDGRSAKDARLPFVFAATPQNRRALSQLYPQVFKNLPTQNDNVNHPSHYTSDPSGVECIEITRHRNFAIGNAIKYLWRAGLKDGNSNIQDLKKAIWYIEDEIKRLENDD